MGSPERFSEPSRNTEVRRDTEVDELLDFLNVYKEIQELMAWLIEASANTDFTVKALRRAHLQRLMEQLGVDPENPDALNKIEEMRLALSDRTLHPQPRLDVPEPSFFKSRIKELIAEQYRYGAPDASCFAVDGVASLIDVAQYGFTDWASVQSRTSTKDISEWIHGVATIMADPVAYQAEFAGLGIDAGHRSADHLGVSYDWFIRNGRHRSLAVRSLGHDYVREAGMSQWVPIAVEERLD